MSESLYLLGTIGLNCSKTLSLVSSVVLEFKFLSYLPLQKNVFEFSITSTPEQSNPLSLIILKSSFLKSDPTIEIIPQSFSNNAADKPI